MKEYYVGYIFVFSKVSPFFLFRESNSLFFVKIDVQVVFSWLTTLAIKRKSSIRIYLSAASLCNNYKVLKETTPSPFHFCCSLFPKFPNKDFALVIPNQCCQKNYYWTHCNVQNHYHTHWFVKMSWSDMLLVGF